MMQAVHYVSKLINMQYKLKGKIHEVAYLFDFIPYFYSHIKFYFVVYFYIECDLGRQRK